MNDIHYLIISSFEETVSLKWGITYISFDDLMHSDTRSKFKMFLFKVDDIKCFQDIVSFLISGGGGGGVPLGHVLYTIPCTIIQETRIYMSYIVLDLKSFQDIW